MYAHVQALHAALQKEAQALGVAFDALRAEQAALEAEQTALQVEQAVFRGEIEKQWRNERRAREIAGKLGV